MRGRGVEAQEREDKFAGSGNVTAAASEVAHVQVVDYADAGVAQALHPIEPRGIVGDVPLNVVPGKGSCSQRQAANLTGGRQIAIHQRWRNGQHVRHIVEAVLVDIICR